jgi:hypothetical protein
MRRTLETFVTMLVCLLCFGLIGMDRLKELARRLQSCKEK